MTKSSKRVLDEEKVTALFQGGSFPSFDTIRQKYIGIFFNSNTIE